MFSRRTDASKIALAHLARWLAEQDFGVIDCQMNTPHLASLGARVPALLEEIQAGLMAQARAFLEANIRDAADYASFKDILENQRGFVRASWCGDEACEARIKAETMATIRVIPLDPQEAETGRPCVACGAKGQALAYFARAY